MKAVKLKSYGSQIRSNVVSLKNAEVSVTNTINSRLAEEDSHDSIQTVRSKRLTHIDISNIIQEYVNYLLNYSASHMHPVSKASSISKLQLRQLMAMFQGFFSPHRTRTLTFKLCKIVMSPINPPSDAHLRIVSKENTVIITLNIKITIVCDVTLYLFIPIYQAA
jgi:hypothetical protein